MFSLHFLDVGGDPVMTGTMGHHGMLDTVYEQTAVKTIET
jgi:hypothetical protein